MRRFMERALKAWPLFMAIGCGLLWVSINEPIYLACALLARILGELEKMNRD